MPVYRVRGPDGAIHRVEGPENADPSVITALVAQNVGRPDVGPQRKYGFGETLSQGAERGFRRLGSTFGDIIPAMGASALGFDDYAKAQLEEAAQSEADIASEIPAEFQSYKDVEGIGDAFKFATQVGSEQLANLATAIVPGVGLGGLAVRGAVGTAAQIAAKKAAGQLLGTYLGSYALNAPEVFQNVYQETGELAPGAAALFSTVSAALDSFLPASLMRTVPAPLKAGIVERLLARSGMDKGLLRSVTSNVLKDTAGESVTEAAQEGISIAAERFINDNPELFGEAEWDRIMESAVQGGVGGGVFGIAGGGAERASEGAQDRQRLFDIREQRAARDAATKSRGEEAAREKEIAEYQQAGPQLGLPGIEPMPYASSLVTPTPNVEEPKVRGKAPTQTEMFTPQGTLTPPAEKMEAKDAKRVAAQAKQAEIVARQAAQQQAAAARIEAQKVRNLQKPSSQQELPLGEPIPLAKNIRPEDAPATTDGQLDIFAGEGITPVAPPAPSSVLPSTKAELLKLFPGATPALGIFKENGPLWGRNLADPKVAVQVKTDLETVGQKYSGKNLNAVETFLARPEFQAIPAPTTVVNPTPTTTSQEDASGKIKTLETETEESELGQETSQTRDADIAALNATIDQNERDRLDKDADDLREENERNAEAANATAGRRAEFDALSAGVDDLGDGTNTAQMQFTSVMAGKKQKVSRARPISPEAEEKANALANTEFRKPTKEAPQTPEEAAAMFFRAYEPASAIRVMIAEGTPKYTETQTVATKKDALNATRWVIANMGVGDVATKHKNDFKKTLTVAQATAVRRNKQNDVDEALSSGKKLNKALDKELKKPVYMKDVPSGLSREDRGLIKENMERGDDVISAANADTAVGGINRNPAKAAIEAELPAQKQAYTEAGGETEQLPPSGPEQIRQIIKGPKYQGKSFDATMRALVEKGNIDAVLDAIIKTAKPEIAQILRKVKSLGLKTKIVIGEAQSGLGLLMSQKPQKYKATGGEAAYIAAADGGKWINFQGLNTLDSVRQAAEQDFKTQANSKPVFKDARPYVNGVLNNPALRGNQRLEALRAQYGDNPARLASDLEGRLVQDHAQAIKTAASLLFAEHKDSPMFMSLVMRMVIADQGATQVAIPMPLLRDALADLRAQWETGNILGIKAARTAYDAAAILHAEAALKLNPNNIKGVEGGEWLELPQGKTQEVFAFWRAMSNANWCTSKGQEQYYAPKGSMYVYRKDGASRMAILFQDGEVDQIQSEDNDGTIPTEYLAEVKNFTAKAKLSRNATRTLERAEKATLQLSKLMALAAPGATFDENGFIELLDGTFGVRGNYEFEVNESLNDRYVAEYLARQKANGSLGRTVSYVLGNVEIRKGAQANALTTVGGNVEIAKGAEVKALTTVGGSADIHEGAQANALTTVGRSAILRKAAQANALTTAGKSVTIFTGAQANALTTVGGDAYMYQDAQANALTTVGGDAYIREGAQVKALTTVGGSADISKGAQANALTTVGENVILYEGAEVKALTTVGGEAYIYQDAQANALTTVGGRANISKGAQANALTTVGGSADIYGGAQANALTTVGENVILYEGAQAKALTAVGGSADIYEGTQANALTTVGKSVIIHKNAQANALTTVGGSADIYGGAQANALTTVGKSVIIHEGAQANALTTVGGNVEIAKGAEVKALTTIGGHVYIYQDAQVNALTTVGGDAYIRLNAQANALTTVGGDADISKGAQANALTTVGKSVTIHEGAQVKALTTVGGSADIHQSATRFPGLRTNVGRREALRGTPLELLNSSDFSGSYNPATDTITLDPESGLNEHIFIHEVLHAALSKVFANPNLKITKDMQKFFMQIKDRMGDSYGGSTLDEFASELVSNPEFQALLKTIKAPRSGSLWDRIMQAIAEFFGFSKGQSAYTAGLNFVSDALDIAEGVEANPIDKLFYGPGKLNDLKSAVSSAAKGTKAQLRDAISSEKDFGWKVKILGAVSLNDMETMFGKELPIKQLETAVETKSGAVDKGIEQVSKNVKKIAAVERKYPKIIISMNKMAIDARRAGIDLIDPAFTPSATQQAEYTRLKNIYNNVLNKEVREVYGLIRKDLDGFLKQFTDYISAVLPNAAATKLLKKFANLHGVTGYVPFLRHGEFWVEYTDPVTGERTPMGRESPAAVEEVVAAVRKQHPQMRDDDFKRYVNIQSLKAPKDMPTASFISDLVAELRANNTDADIVDSVYQQYHSMFPANSIMQQFNKAKMLPGMDEDIVRSYADVSVKWVHKLANMEHNPKIFKALTAIKQAASKDGKYGADLNIQAVAKSINAQQESFLNLTYHPLARGLTTGSYYLHILGSVASAAINLSGLMFFVYPILGGRFGFPATLTAMLDAGKLAIGSWGTGKYKALYESLDARGLLKHTIAREALERSKTSGKDFSGLIDKVIELLSIPFGASERYMRGATAIAAYELALKGGPNQKAMSPAEAIEFAAKTVKDTHTAGMSEVSPAYFKNDFGRVILTFKKIAFQQTFVIARAFHQALVASDIPPEAKKIARQQLLGIFGMSGAFLGASGLPLYGMFSTLARMLEALIPDDDDEPYDPNMQLRGLTGDFLYEGLIAKLFNIDVSKRAALANDIIFRDDPQSVKDMGYVKTVLFNLLGPMGGYAANTGRAIDNIADGNIERGLETMLPTFVANGMKGIRYMADGAETLDGEPIDEDVNAWNGFMQMFGFAPADLAETQEMRSAAKNYENKILARKQKILDRYNMAYAAGDMDMVREARDDARAFRRRYPKLMASDTLERSRRGREAAAEDMIRGLRFTKSLRPDIEQRFNLGPE